MCHPANTVVLFYKDLYSQSFPLWNTAKVLAVARLHVTVAALSKSHVPINPVLRHAMLVYSDDANQDNMFISVAKYAATCASQLLINELEYPQLSVNGNVVPRVPSVKLLGFAIQHKLQRGSQVRAIWRRRPIPAAISLLSSSERQYSFRTWSNVTTHFIRPMLECTAPV